ncbi:MAG: DUF3597 domain-containing protein [Chthoniobacterales bacterium]
MGLFNNLMSKIFNHGGSSGNTGGGSAPAPTTSAPTSAPAGNVGGAAQPAAGAPSQAAAPQTVDVAANLNAMAAKNEEKLDWKHSIVDLMKLVGMDSSLSSRKELAKDLNYSGDTNDSAAMNIWLHKEVLRKLSQNGGKVPAELLN